MAKKILVLFFLCAFFTCSNVSAFQFENFKWGITTDEARKIVEGQRKPIESRDKNKIVYSDLIFGEPCKVSLSFSPGNNLLNEVMIKWESTMMGEKIKAILTEKYGESTQSGDLHKIFFWYGRSDRITLDYASMDTRLTYSCG